jgi:flagellin-like hook-associated protein FlgL
MATVINRSMFPLSSGINNIMNMKQRYDVLQTQLASGKKAETLADMGTDRFFNLALRQRISRIDSFKDSIKTVDLRVNVLDQTVSRMATIEADMRAVTLSGSGGQSSLNFETAPATAMAAFDEVLTLLNADVAGRYLFGGNKTENRPVADGLSILNGDGGKAGFMQVMGERKQADLGASHLGRLTIGTTTDTVTLAEDGTHPFGLKLSTVTSSSGNITLTQPTGAPPALSVQFGATLPGEGDNISFNFTMPDGTQETVLLTASTDPGSVTSFQIGVDADTTAANLDAALNLAITKLAEGKLVTTSAYAAAEDFFFGHGETPMRVDGPPFDSATGQVAGTAGDTVIWYTGDDSTDPRRSVTARVGEGATVAYGVEATEEGLVNLVRALAVMGTQNFPQSDASSTDRYTAMTARNNERLSAAKASNAGSLPMIAVELGLAKATSGNVSERHDGHKAQLNNMLQDIEEAPVEVVAMELLALKTRLEASYQATAMISNLSLVNYIK